MKVKLKNEHSVSLTEIAQCEDNLGVVFPDGYKNLVQKNNGAQFEPNIITLGNGTEIGVCELIPVGDVERVFENIHSPAKLFPIAIVEGGNYILLDLNKGGEIVFWDHERPDSYLRIAADIDSFLEALEPFDMDSIDLKPGQVESAWIDPDFLNDEEQ